MGGQRITLLGAPLDLLSMSETVARAEAAMQSGQRLQQVVINVAKLVHMRSDADLRRDVMESDIINIDGMGVLWAVRLLGYKAPERVAGIDLMMALIASCARRDFKPYFLGARPDVLEAAMSRLRAEHPGLTIAGYRNGYFGVEDEAEVVADIHASGAHCLFVAISSPLKERFLHQYRDQLGVPYLMGVGGSLDVVSGRVSRAPLWMRQLGFEWLYRLCQEPRRMWRRYLVTNTIFFFLLLGELARTWLSGKRQ
ncbi:MAG: WecB/TagA/CpsF family glycosyltransferase [Rhodospirillaceae bacterium]|jgi:N-acetylglucosaminyldiphosphoundecaprenol N-acetyl-beta-D-mannosaminyltransferase|nr:WecB/TagA/CpsF family glycosyltransferase [Rhodospirillaceae bacterium]MBT4487237.1 WecB/TagA/CpsF family glycosyltransferase [Rhodospirillaceae bacterium]MBT5191914.1 WecB/TagA/CpsF family glycosyltransferase [Rhodospirillaceae bacterium]MBT7757765.1 WecB/TagA/CpsF family glycosyltransferase [Rhodospirillaceae bacterium]